MTNVVAFRAPPRRGTAALRRAEPAAILFFTGVRYVRDDDAPPPAAPARKTAAPAARPATSERLQA